MLINHLNACPTMYHGLSSSADVTGNQSEPLAGFHHDDDQGLFMGFSKLSSQVDGVQSSSRKGGYEMEAKKMTQNKKCDKKTKRPRYAFQTRSTIEILDDGYRWRKYGQKTVKNNMFPRSYYRCTYLGCNVKKQVQRMAKDEGTVVTTYEGVHTHPIQKPTDNFESILREMQIYNPSPNHTAPYQQIQKHNTASCHQQ